MHGPVPPIFDPQARWKALAATLAFVLIAYALRVWLRPRWAETYKRGVVVVDGKRARRCAWRRQNIIDAGITLAGAPIAARDETKHFKLLGTTGTGKSTAIREMLAGAIRRGDRAVIADPDGGYLSRFYARYRGDVILNPFATDSVKWDWSAEIQHYYDVEQLASGLIPSSNDASGQEWRGYARTFLTAVARRCCEAGRARFLRIVATADGCSGRGIAPGRRRHARATVSRSGQRPYVRFDTIGDQLRCRRARTCSGAARRPRFPCAAGSAAGPRVCCSYRIARARSQPCAR